jgi:hypothetical protein
LSCTIQFCFFFFSVFFFLFFSHFLFSHIFQTDSTASHTISISHKFNRILQSHIDTIFYNRAQNQQYFTVSYKYLHHIHFTNKKIRVNKIYNSSHDSILISATTAQLPPDLLCPQVSLLGLLRLHALVVVPSSRRHGASKPSLLLPWWPLRPRPVVTERALLDPDRWWPPPLGLRLAEPTASARTKEYYCDRD